MSGGFLVVLSHSGKDEEKYDVHRDSVKLGSGLDCQIRIVTVNVKPHHASITVRCKLTVIRDFSKGGTYVNGEPVSLHALSHCDIITIGNRSFRWEYDLPGAVKKAALIPLLPVRGIRKNSCRPVRVRMSEVVPRKLDPTVRITLELKHRASVPGNTKQVAIVQPRRRDAADMPEIKRIVQRPRLNTSANKRTPRKVTTSTSNTSITKSARKRTRSPKRSPRVGTSTEIPPDQETKASQWIASRKCTPRNQVATPKNDRYVHVATPRPNTPYADKSPSKMMASKTPKRVLAIKKSTPLRTTVLRRAITPKLNLSKATPKRTPRERVEKIEDPAVMDKNKKAALILLTRTPQSKIFSPKARQTPVVVLKKPNTPVNVSGRKSRKTRSVSAGDASGLSYATTSNVISISDYESDCMLIADESSKLEDSIQSTSSSAPSPKKSSLKRPDSKKKSNNSSIKFDLSNIENDSADMFLVADSSCVSDHARLSKVGRNSRSLKILQNSRRMGSMSTSFDDTLAKSTHSPKNHSDIWNSQGAQSRDRIEGTPVIPMERIFRHSAHDARTSQTPRAATQERRPSEDSGDSNKTDENAPQPPNEENITPKSTVKLIPEAVKHKHSTAKKPKSKRALIDNLDESDVVKNLFNSPVKRKLSRSMIEFNRSLEEEAGVRKRTRRTIAGCETTTDHTIPNYDSPLVPTELFVSTLDKTTKSPVLDGVKTLFDKRTPNNDLRDVKGVKRLLKTPQARKSIVNDLTDVSGVKNVFTRVRTPRNDLSDVRGVKQMFGRQQKNDLRRVSGVKTLFRSQKERQSPNNDLTDVRGVRRIFKRDASQNSLNLSGVEELFNESSTSTAENLLENMVDKPAVKETYSKSVVVDKPKSTQKKVSSRSLTSNVVVNKSWLNKAKVAAKRHTKAKNVSFKANKTRELSRLVTDTLAGVTPLQNSRMRIDSSTDNSTLPLKKRSLTTNVSKSRDNGRSVLPIKKRVIVHSTPVKANISTLMVPTEMGKVSPIASTGKTVVLEVTMSPKRKTPIKTKATPKKRGTKREIVTSPVNISPRKTRANRTAKASKKDKRASLVITKKPPIMSPEGGTRKGAGRVKKETSKPLRQTRGRPKQDTSKVNMERSSKGKTTKDKQIKKTDDKEPKDLKSSEVNKKRRKVDTNDIVTDEAKPAKGTRGRRRNADLPATQVKSDFTTPEPPSRRRARRMSKPITETLVQPSTKITTTKLLTRGQKKGTSASTGTDASSKAAEPNVRGRGKKVPSTELPANDATSKRFRKKEPAIEDKPQGKKADEDIEKSTTKGKGKKVDEKKRGRGANKDDQQEPVVVVEERKQRGRKRKADDGTPVKETKKRQTRATNVSEKPKSPGKGKVTRARAASTQTQASTRGGRRRN